MPRTAVASRTCCPVKAPPAVVALILCATGLLCPTVAWADTPTAILLDDFEDGVGAWRANDSTLMGEQRPARYSGIYPISDTPPGGGAQAAVIDFPPAKGAWASISLPVDGKRWAAHDIGLISMWVKQAEAGNEVLVTLRVNAPTAGGRTEDRSYYQTLRPDGKAWQRVSLRLFGFRDHDGESLPPDLRSAIYLLQFVKTGSWERVRMHVDTIEARPLDYPATPGATTTPEQPAGADLITIDMSKDIGRCLAQVGFNLAAGSVATGSNRKVSETVSKLAADLAPCVGRLRVAHCFVPRTSSYDIASLNAAVNWLVSAGIKPLLCFGMPSAPADPTGPSAERMLYQTAVDIADLRRGAQLSPYYELFEDPITRPDSTVPGFERVRDLATAYNGLAAGIANADRTARIGGSGFRGADEWAIREFAAGVDPLAFVSYRLVYQGPMRPGDKRMETDILRGFSGGAYDWTYEQAARYLDEVTSRPELFITDWGISREPETNRQAGLENTAGEAVFLAASALAASRHVDKLLWTSLVDDNSGLIDVRGRPRPAYWAAWLLCKYAPRGSTCSALLDYRSRLLVAAVRTKTSANVFVVNRTPWPMAVTLRVTGVGTTAAVREHRLDIMEANEVRHRNLSLSTTQNVSLSGPGVTVVQFVPPT